MGFIPILMLLFVVETQFDIGVYEIKIADTPAVQYDTNTKSWAVPSYNEVKEAVKCLETKGIKCLNGRSQ